MIFQIDVSRAGPCGQKQAGSGINIPGGGILIFGGESVSKTHLLIFPGPPGSELKPMTMPEDKCGISFLLCLPACTATAYGPSWGI